MAGGDRGGGERPLVVGRDLAQELRHDPVRHEFRVRGLADGRLVIVGEGAGLREEVGVVGGQSVLADEALAPRRRQLGQACPRGLHRLPAELERHQVGLGEVPVVVGLLLAAHHPRPAAVGVPQARLLQDPLAAVERLPLAQGLELERALHVLERVQVLDLDLGAEVRRPPPAQGDVRVAAEAPLLHVAVADAEVEEDRAEGAEVGRGLLRRADVRLRDRFHQRHARAIEVHQARAGGLERALVDQPAHVLLEVQALDGDAPGLAEGLELEPPVLGERLLVLTDLVVLRHVGVVVVLPREPAARVDPAVERQRRADPELDRPPVDHGEAARHALADGAGLAVGRRPEVRRAAAEHLGARPELGVHLEADDDLVRRGRVRHGSGGRRACQRVACS